VNATVTPPVIKIIGSRDRTASNLRYNQVIINTSTSGFSRKTLPSLGWDFIKHPGPRVIIRAGSHEPTRLLALLC